MRYLLYNPLSNNNRGKQRADGLLIEIGEAELIDVTAIKDESLRAWFENRDIDNDEIYLVGGDGTLQRFANIVYGLNLPPIYFYGAGTGNDFLRDLGPEAAKGGAKINQYLKDLPLLTIGDKSLRFINGIGYGLDGMVCELADKIKEKSDRKISYTMLALKCCAYAYKARKATVTVDGLKNEYEGVWICPTMKGRYYGGGMMVAPNQDRLNSEHTVSLVVGHCRSRLKLLALLTTIKKGKHTKSSAVEIFNAKSVKVEFSKPCALQVDGETYLNVSGYQVEV